MNIKNSVSIISLSERLMALGWWDEAKRTLSNHDVDCATRNLHQCLLDARHDCVEWVNQHKNQEIETRDMLREFDRYTVYWVLHNYIGEDSAEWQIKSAKANVLTD